MAPILYSPGAKIVFAAASLRSFSLLVGKNNALCVALIALAAVSNWALLIKAKEFVEQTISPFFEEFKQLSQLSSSVAAPGALPPPPVLSSREPVSRVSNSHGSTGPIETKQEIISANIPEDLVDKRTTFLNKNGTPSPVKKKQASNIQRNDGVLLGPDNVDSSVLMDE